MFIAIRFICSWFDILLIFLDEADKVISQVAKSFDFGGICHSKLSKNRHKT